MTTFLAMLSTVKFLNISDIKIMHLTNALYGERVGEDDAEIMYHSDNKSSKPLFKHPSQYYLAQEASFC